MTSKTINPIDVQERLSFVKDTIVELTESKEDSGIALANYLTFADSFKFCELNSKAMYNLLFESLTVNNSFEGDGSLVVDGLQRVYNQVVQVFTEEEVDVVIDIIDRAVLDFKRSDVSSLDDAMADKDAVNVDGPLKDFKALLKKQPWYMVTIIALI